MGVKRFKKGVDRQISHLLLHFFGLSRGCGGEMMGEFGGNGKITIELLHHFTPLDRPKRCKGGVGANLSFNPSLLKRFIPIGSLKQPEKM